MQAFECKAVNKQGSKEVESFAHVLSEMLTSLQVNASTMLLQSIKFITFCCTTDLEKSCSIYAAMGSQISKGIVQSFFGA